MLVAAAGPMVVAHNDIGQPGPTGRAPQGGDEVFGWYHGAAGPVVNESNELGQVAAVFILCDAEVQDATLGITEPVVDGTPTGNTGAPEGTFDDGGQGGVCHTEDHYANDDWNTPGCSDFNDNGVNDRVGGQDRTLASAGGGGNELDTFVIASCDSETRDTNGLVTCVVNALVLGPTPVEGLKECPDRVNPAEPNPGVFLGCGSDFDADYATTGYVDHDASKVKNNFPAPTTGPNCDSGSLSLFVLAGVDAVNQKVSVTTQGWVGTLNK